MTKAIVVAAFGGPSAMAWRDVTVGRPGRGQLALRHTAIGVNYIDVYHRTGFYKSGLPLIPGVEAAGVVTAVGRGVDGFKPGDRVAYMSPPPGAYAEQRLYPANQAFALPRSIPDELAAAMLLKGMAAQVLLRQVRRIGPGDRVLVHAAAGGVGSILTQWAKFLGATVIGTAGGPAKLRRARQHGCDHVIDYTTEDFVARVKRLTKGAGVTVVYDSVGKATVPGSLECLGRLGMLVCFGQSSGPAAPIDPLMLGGRGLFVTRAGIYTYADTPDKLRACAREVFRAWRAGAFTVDINQRYALADAAKAHADLEARKTTGSTLLIP